MTSGIAAKRAPSHCASGGGSSFALLRKPSEALSIRRCSVPGLQLHKYFAFHSLKAICAAPLSSALEILSVFRGNGISDNGRPLPVVLSLAGFSVYS